eukprot:764780-Hanusia_phi.AAC.1
MGNRRRWRRKEEERGERRREKQGRGEEVEGGGESTFKEDAFWMSVCRCIRERGGEFDPRTEEEGKIEEDIDKDEGQSAEEGSGDMKEGSEGGG